MLSNICRAVTSKQSLMADQSENCKRPLNPSFFGSPRFKSLDQTLLTPTSTLDNISPKSFPAFCNSLFCEHDQTLNQMIPKSPKVIKPKNEGIGLALIKSCDPDHKNKMVLFGTKLRMKIPTQLTESSPTQQPPGSKISTGVSEMDQLSEDYTCIISHGPDPKTTHIFDNCIVETYLCLSDNHYHHSTKDNINQVKKKKIFLSCCHTCNKNLEQSNDIYIYRGEKAFCSQECRYQEIGLDEADQS
jgi:hypothetical protein